MNFQLLIKQWRVPRSTENKLSFFVVFFYKSSPCTRHNWHCAIGFFIITAHGNVYFLQHYRLFFRKDSFFEYLHFSVFDVRIFLFVFWLRNRPSMKYICNYENKGGSSKMFTDANRGRGVSRFMCTYAHLFSRFCLMVSWFICKNLTLPSFKKDVFLRNDYFSPTRSSTVVMK